MYTLYYIFFIINIRLVDSNLIQNQNKPICANCKFFIHNKNECSIFGNVNIITGKYSYESAAIVRNIETKCGEDAIFFKKNHFKLITQTYYYLLANNLTFFLYLSLNAILVLYWNILYLIIK